MSFFNNETKEAVTKMKIAIKRDFYDRPRFYIWAVLVWSCFFSAIVNYLHFPTAISYLMDFMCLILLYAVLRNLELTKRTLGSTGGIIALMLIESVISFCFNIYNPLVFVWGIRTLFRFVLYFVASSCYSDKDTVEKILTFLYIVVLLTVPLVTIQSMQGYGLDATTGFFSLGKATRGGSSGMNMLLTVVCTYAILQYFEKKWSLFKMMAGVFAGVYIAALGELKIFYFELLLIIVLSVFLTKMSLKKGFGIVFLSVIFLMGLSIYQTTYGNGYYYQVRGYTFFSWEAVQDYIGLTGESYGSFNSLNRATAIPYVWNNFLVDGAQKLFGLGTGYADTVSSDVFSSGFLSAHSGLGYQFWFVSLELANIGVVGLLLFYVLFVMAYKKAMKGKKIDEDNRVLYATAQIMIIICVITTFYNQALIIDIAAPIMYFCMSIPYCLQKK